MAFAAGVEAELQELGPQGEGTGAPQPPETLDRLHRWTTAALEQFLLMMWDEMLQVRHRHLLHPQIPHLGA